MNVGKMLFAQVMEFVPWKAFGRIISRHGAGPIEAHARLFNYPAESEVRTLEDVSHLGFKTIFFSKFVWCISARRFDGGGRFSQRVRFW